MLSIIILVIIYLSFISLGLPDSVLGTALPAIVKDWGISLSSGGLISMTVVGGTIVSSFISGYMIKRFGTWKIVLISCLLTGSALLGFSAAPSILWLILLAIPLGLGGGSVDTALNNYVALNYKAHHMNWLHSFWGVGATLGPVIMSVFLNNNGAWQGGYRTIALIQLSLALVLFLTLPLWRRAGTPACTEDSDNYSADAKRPAKPMTVFKINGVKASFLSMMLYVAVEASIGLWGSTYLIGAREFTIENAASWLAFYYGGITAGRFISGFISFKFSNVQLIRWGIIIAFTGIVLLVLPLNNLLTGCAIVLTGMGLAPVFPSMLHETPNRFGKGMSQILIGYQMGFAYIGGALLAPAIGIILQYTSISLFPLYLTGFIAILLLATEILTKKTVTYDTES